jgi:hypothetical protein
MGTCPECRGVGWLLNERHAGAGSVDPALPVSLDLLPCIYPACDATHGPHRDPRPIATLGIRGQFTNVVWAPDGTLLALDGYTAPAYR